MGVLAAPQMRGVLGLAGAPVTLTGRLVGGARAGLGRDGWPQWQRVAEPLPAWRAPMTPALARYAAVMGWDGTGPLGLGEGGAEGPPDPALAAEIARLILRAPGEPERVAARLPMIGTMAASRLRGAAMAPSGAPVVPLRPGGAEVQATRQPYAGFFAVEEWDLRHRRHDGGWTDPITRSGLVSGDAVVVLPYDPVRDRVLVIEQFRLAPLLRADPQPWLLEPVAGRIDAGETPEDAARREAVEEAGLRLDRLVPAVHHYPSPGCLGEFLYLYVAVTDLPDDAAGLHGLASEAEDIRGHLLPRMTLAAMVAAGAITNGPLAMLSLWLDARAGTL